MTPGSLRDRDAVVDAAHRDHADRAARPVHELDVRGQQVVDAVLVDRVRVPAADLHHLVVAAGLDRGEDLPGQHPAELGVAELVDEPHATAARSQQRERDAGVHEHDVAGLDRRHQLDVDQRTGLARIRRLATEREPGRPRRRRRRASATPWSLHVMQTQCAAGRRLGPSLDHARLQLLELLLVVRAHVLRAAPSVAWASSSSTFESAKPTWISTQSPGSHAAARRRRAGRR